MKLLKQWYYFLLIPAIIGIAFPTLAQAGVDLDTPVNDAHCVPLDVVFEWSYDGSGGKTVAADGYGITISTNVDFSEPLEEEAGMSSGTFTTGTLEFNTVYFWLAEIKYTDFSSESTSGTFTTNGPPSLVGPLNNRLCIDYSAPYLEWQDMGADSYTVDIATSSTFGIPDIVETSSSTVTNLTAGALTPNTKYYWRVVANYTTLCSSSSTFSDVWAFTTEALAPNNMTPVHNTTCVLEGAEFQWNDVANAVSYDFQYSSSSTFSPTETTLVENLESSSYTMPVGDLDHDTKYYWRARAVFASYCKTDWSAAFALTTSQAPPTLTFPDDEASGVTLEPTLTWSVPEEPVDYELMVATDPGFTTLVYDETGLAPSSTFTSSFTLDDITSPLDYNVQYYWKVRANYASCTSDWSEIFTFRTYYPAVTLVSPTSGTECVSIMPELQWNHIIGASKYYVQVSENADMSEPEVNMHNIDTSVYVPTLENAMTQYFWRVMAEDGVNSGLWSPIWSFTTTNFAPVLVKPVNDSSGIPLDIKFEWLGIGADARYELQVDEDADFSSPVFSEANLAFNTLTRTMPDYFQTYYWRVRGTLNGCASDWSESFSFTTKLPAPVLVTPANNAIKQPLVVTFSWQPSSGADTYEFQLSSSSSSFTYEYLIDSKANLESHIYIASGELEVNTSYYWRVKAHNSRGESVWSPVYKFTTGQKGPTTPMLISPTNKVEQLPTTVTVKWTSAERAETYNLQVAKNYQFIDPIYNETGITDTTFELTNLDHLRTYYWRVSAESEYGTSAWSTIWSFQTMREAPEDKPTLNQPYDKMEGVMPNLTFSWDHVARASAYELQVSEDYNFSNLVVHETSLLTNYHYTQALDYEKTYYWRVRAKNEAGNGPWSNVWYFTTMTNSVYDEMKLIHNVQVMPNPFSGETQVHFVMPEANQVSLRVVNVMGETIDVLVNERYFSSGDHSVKWNPEGLESGMYFYIINIGEFTEMKKIVFTK